MRCLPTSLQGIKFRIRRNANDSYTVVGYRRNDTCYRCAMNIIYES